MRWSQIFRLRLRSLFSRAAIDRELDEELRYHIEREVDAGIAAGLSPEEARATALRAIEGFEQKKEECRDTRGLNIFNDSLRDARFALRELRRDLAFTVTAVLTLALGICASLAIFAFVNAALLKPLPYQRTSELAGVYERSAAFQHSNISYLDYLDWKRSNTVFRSLDVYHKTGMVLSAGGAPSAVNAAAVSAGFFDTLGVQPAIGRTFKTGEDVPGAARTVMLSDAVWRNRFGARSGIVGQVIDLDGEPHTVVGVLPRAFIFPPVGRVDFWVPLHATEACELRRSCHDLNGVARLKPGISLAVALANCQAIAARLERTYPDSNHGQGASVIPLTEAIVGQIRPLLLVLFSGAGLLLLIAVVNVVALLLVRSEKRKREIAMRRALGASTTRIFRQLITESLLLVLAGAVPGLVLSFWMSGLLLRLIPETLLAYVPFLADISLDARTLAVTVVLALAAAILFSLAPLRHLATSDLRDSLAEGGRGSARNTWSRVGSKLVVVELAIATVLLVSAGLLTKSFFRLFEVDLGLNPDRLITLRVTALKTAFKEDARLVAWQRQLRAEIRATPGVVSVGTTSVLPVTENGSTDWIRIPGRPFHGEHNEVNERDVSPDYFPVIGGTFIRGRNFTESDDENHPNVVVINQAFARRYFPGEDPIGQRIGDTKLTPKSMREIVGVVADVRDGGLDQPIWPAEYEPFAQSPDQDFNLLVRVAGDEQRALNDVTALLRRKSGIVVEPGSAVRRMMNDSPAAYIHRSCAWLVTGFAAAALLLGIVGLYGVIAYSVGQRAREIGVRMALGAQPRMVYSLILREAGRLSVAGLAAGVLCSLLTSAMLARLLFHVDAWDPATLTAVVAVLATAAIVASFVPAHRAASIDPVETLRAE